MARFVDISEINPVLVRELSWSDRLQCMVGPFYVDIAGTRVRIDQIDEEDLGPNETNMIPNLCDDTVITLDDTQCQMIVDAINNLDIVKAAAADGRTLIPIPTFEDDNMSWYSLGCAWSTLTDAPTLTKVVLFRNFDD